MTDIILVYMKRVIMLQILFGIIATTIPLILMKIPRTPVDTITCALGGILLGLCAVVSGIVVAWKWTMK